MSLPVSMKYLLEKGGPVWRTLKKNILRIDSVAPVVATGTFTKYYIFMKMSKVEPPEQQKFIRLFVETAYPESVLHDSVAAIGKPYNFHQLVGDCWQGKYPGK